MSVEERVEKLQNDIAKLHEVLAKQGWNTTGETDIFGRPFYVPVDSEHKATVFNAWTLMDCHNPHMRGFWSAAFGFFCTFFSTFAAAPLMAYIKKPTSLDLTKGQIGWSNIASVAGTIAMRVISGWLCEKFGARRAFFGLLMLPVPGIIGIAFTQGAAGFIICRFLIGLGLATFVTCQVWCSQLFNRKVVGAANATAGGWGNLGGGITNLVMPFVMLGFLNATDENEDIAWRLCYIVPLALHMIAGMFVLSGRDLPDGNFAELETSGAKQKTNSKVVICLGVSNINAWILVITYGFCFGVELTMTNVAALYFYTYHGASPQLAGVYAACFGLMNIFARSWGGIISDASNAKYGMRGRLWAMWIVQVIEGTFCIIMGVVTRDYDSPDGNPDGSKFGKVVGTFENGGYEFSLEPGHKNYMVGGCATLDLTTPDKVVREPGTNSSVTLTTGTCGTCIDLGTRLLIGDNEHPNCVRNQDLLGLVVFIMMLFSTTVQMAEGLHFGVVPYVCRPALGIVSGMVGAGGNSGAVLTLWTIFKNTSVARTDDGYVILGAVIVSTSLLMFAIYFPDMGGMLFKAGSLKYDPQRVKVPEGYRGADVLDHSVAAGADKVKEVEKETKPVGNTTETV
eukprot:CAMPEP_0119351322 /NCGR_PEP_ID=MMETSP1334-20130426/619_1 /TAXON_ID=127549 /ORGANISM="Calcidiscus leptoporus, Strain RCC1130" /LENGTH=623 /DNA_ID=CAMNT_0007364095 /DNA_START=49 /DNA_END=1920 /DNA_ORIENTATION=-